MTRTHRIPKNDRAVSPVVGVMLMLVVVIIIAAVVSGFAGGLMSGQKKAPQATIQATFSQTKGMEITHAGGDTLATADLVFTVTNNPEFGQGIEQISTQVLNTTIITNDAGASIMNVDGTSSVPSFSTGDTLKISRVDIDPQYFQPVVAPCDPTIGGTSSIACPGTKNIYYYVTWTGSGWSYAGNKTQFWALDFVNPDNAGKTFAFTVTDKKGNLISSTDVKITP